MPFRTDSLTDPLTTRSTGPEGLAAGRAGVASVVAVVAVADASGERDSGGELRGGLCGSTAFGACSMWVFMVSVLRSLVVWGANPTTCGSASRPTGGNPRLHRRAGTAFAFIASHTV